MSLGLYLHIPYCFSKCRYCDFYSHPGERGVPDAYVDALLRELHRFAPNAPLRPDTVYFGGGTPSLLTPAQAERLIRAAEPVPGAEITLEANPETVTEESLRGFRAAGVNRISFGVQSARDTQLRTLGRPHSAKQARAAFAAARRAGGAAWLVVLLVVISLVQILSYKLANNYELKHRDAKAKLTVTQDYLDRQAYAVENGKDIRLYQMKEWLSGHYRAANKKYQALLAKEKACYFDRVGSGGAGGRDSGRT